MKKYFHVETLIKQIKTSVIIKMNFISNAFNPQKVFVPVRTSHPHSDTLTHTFTHTHTHTHIHSHTHSHSTTTTRAYKHKCSHYC